MSVYQPPKAKKWQKAERWQVGLWDNKFALCGLRMLWVVIGTKWVYMSAPVCQTRMKITRKEWNALTDKERYHTDEDIQIYREKRNKIWEEAKAKRIALEKWIRDNPGVNNTKFKKRRRKIV